MRDHWIRHRGREPAETCIFNQLRKRHYWSLKLSWFLPSCPNTSCPLPSSFCPDAKNRVPSTYTCLQPHHPFPPQISKYAANPYCCIFCFIIVSSFHNCSIIISFPLMLGTLSFYLGKNFLAVIHKIFYLTLIMVKNKVLESDKLLCHLLSEIK